jgi:NADH-quinone oxidoreductase subunit K
LAIPALGAVLFAISLAGIFLNRKNVIVLLMAIELMLLSVNINFVASRVTWATGRPGVRVLHPDRGRGRIGHRPGDPGVLFRTRRTINVGEIDSLKG